MGRDLSPGPGGQLGERKGQRDQFQFTRRYAQLLALSMGDRKGYCERAGLVWVAATYIPSALPPSQEALPGVSHSPGQMKPPLLLRVAPPSPLPR